MAGQVVQMDYAVVGDVSKGFSNSEKMLQMVGKALEIAVQVLRAMAFASMGTSLALANYLDNIKNKVNALAKVCAEFANDLSQAVNDHRRGDYQGKTYFGKGIKV